MRVLATALVVTFLFMTPAESESRTWYVTADGMGDVPTIQAGIDSAAGGDTVELADGTYVGAGNRDLDFQGKNLILISESRDPLLCKIDVAADTENLHRAFYFHSGESRSARVEGIGIIRGYVQSTEYPTHTGGGVLCTGGSSPTFVNCRIEGCGAGVQAYGLGGGVACWYGASPLFEDCEILENFATNGGGGIFTESSSPEFSNCRVERNFVSRGERIGGGALCRSGSSPQFRDCRFEQNSLEPGGGSSGGACYIFANCDAVFSDCDFVNNTAYWSGGGVFCKENSDCVFTDCGFISNYAAGGFGGGLICTSESSPQLTRCDFIGNQAGQHGGAAFLTEQCMSVFTDCLFVENEAAQVGGAIQIQVEASPHFVGCTIADNQSGGRGSGIHVSPDSGLDLDRCIIAFNTTEEGVLVSEGSVVTARCCDIYGNAEGDWIPPLNDLHNSNGNICKKPLFCGALHYPSDPYRLDIASPCARRNPPCLGELIGARGTGCSDGVAVDRMTWGRVKGMYR